MTQSKCIKYIVLLTKLGLITSVMGLTEPRYLLINISESILCILKVTTGSDLSVFSVLTAVSVTWCRLTASWWSQMRKAGGEPLWLRVSTPSNRKPLLSLLLHIHRGGQPGPVRHHVAARPIQFAPHLRSLPVKCPRRRVRWGCEEVGASRRMIVATKARCPGRTHLKIWPRETGMLWGTKGPVSTPRPCAST